MIDIDDTVNKRASYCRHSGMLTVELAQMSLNWVSSSLTNYSSLTNTRKFMLRYNRVCTFYVVISTVINPHLIEINKAVINDI